MVQVAHRLLRRQLGTAAAASAPRGTRPKRQDLCLVPPPICWPPDAQQSANSVRGGARRGLPEARWRDVVRADSPFRQRQRAWRKHGRRAGLRRGRRRTVHVGSA
eukprot:306366-Chlamydomonas_euryale.AAC.1